jgi:hypothetical protein
LAIPPRVIRLLNRWHDCLEELVALLKNCRIANSE